MPVSSVPHPGDGLAVDARHNVMVQAIDIDDQWLEP